MGRTGFLPDDLYDYILQVGVTEHPVLVELRRETARLPEASMQISPDEGAFLAWLIKVLDARRVLEVGVFTGYSSLAMTLASPEVTVTALDVSLTWTATARSYWEKAGVRDRIELKLGPALKTLADLPSSHFDLVFIDADKPNYPAYYERAVDLVRPGGVVAVDNVLWSGRVVRPDDDSGRAIDETNRRAAADGRVDRAVVPIGDGVLLCRKKVSESRGPG
ncbi:MAG: class I SAM-dependent methyltransferase [Acidimicrobiia bacterium]